MSYAEPSKQHARKHDSGLRTSSGLAARSTLYAYSSASSKLLYNANSKLSHCSGVAAHLVFDSEDGSTSADDRRERRRGHEADAT